MDLTAAGAFLSFTRFESRLDFFILSLRTFCQRFTRKKHDSSFPINSVQYCISEANINPNQIDHIVFYEKPFLKFERLLETYLAFAPKGFRSFLMSMPIWLKEKLFQKKFLFDNLLLKGLPIHPIVHLERQRQHSVLL
mgnify:CR=1 FL=1